MSHINAIVNIITLINYVLIFFYGAILSVDFAGECDSKQKKRSVAILCLLILSLQAFCYFLLGLNTTKKLYPLITHLPLLLILIFALKQRFDVSLTAIVTSYFCCQPPKWFGIVAFHLSGNPLAYEIVYFVILVPLFLILHRYLANTLYQAITQSKRTLILFGLLPLGYYLFDYTTTVYSSLLYSNLRIINEFWPTVMVFFYIISIVLYHNELQKANQLELDNLMLTTQSKQAKKEIKNLRHTQQQAANYRHDLRHHISLIYNMLDAGQTQKAMDYISQMQDYIEAITPKRFCENETANLIISSFAQRTTDNRINLAINVDIPSEIHILDTELCSILSNSLENAINACLDIESGERFINLRVYVKNNKVCIDISNNCITVPIFKNGVPISNVSGHGIGVKSMVNIIKKYNGVYRFSFYDNIFTFQASI